MPISWRLHTSKTLRVRMCKDTKCLREVLLIDLLLLFSSLQMPILQYLLRTHLWYQSTIFDNIFVKFISHMYLWKDITQKFCIYLLKDISAFSRTAGFFTVEFAPLAGIISYLNHYSLKINRIIIRNCAHLLEIEKLHPLYAKNLNIRTRPYYFWEHASSGCFCKRSSH